MRMNVEHVEQGPEEYWKLTGTVDEDGIVSKTFEDGIGGSKEEVEYADGDKMTIVNQHGELVEHTTEFADGKVLTVFGNGGMRLAYPAEGVLVDLPTPDDVARHFAQLTPDDITHVGTGPTRDLQGDIFAAELDFAQPEDFQPGPDPGQQ